MKTVSQEYILGIKEGRALLNSNPDFTIQDMEECTESCKRLARDFSQPMKDVFKGERDFWLNQIKIRSPKL